MALKPDRDVLQDDISHFIAAITNGGERGVMVVATGATPSGAAMDQTVNQVVVPLQCSGKNPLGLLDNDVVNVDLTRQTLNPYKAEQLVGDKVRVIRKGWVVTNMVVLADGAASASAPSNGTAAYAGPSGYLTPLSSEGKPLVGKFLSTADEDGYYKVLIDL